LRVLSLFVFLFGAIFFASCAYFSSQETAPKESSVPKETSKPAPKVETPADPHLEAGQQFLKQGKNKEAVAEFEAVLKNNPSNSQAANGLRLAQKKLKDDRERTIQNLTQLNDRALEFYHREDAVMAGLAWREAIDLLRSQNDPTLEHELPFRTEEVTGRLDQLARVLVDKGVLLYRQGDLQRAIAVWQDVLLIEPEHPEAKDYIHKARIKLDTLEKLSTTPVPPEPPPAP